MWYERSKSSAVAVAMARLIHDPPILAARFPQLGEKMSEIVRRCMARDPGERFPSVVVHDNVWGTQFHPEKSGEDGLGIVRKFVEFGNARTGGTR